MIGDRAGKRAGERCNAKPRQGVRPPGGRRTPGPGKVGDVDADDGQDAVGDAVGEGVAVAEVVAEDAAHDDLARNHGAAGPDEERAAADAVDAHDGDQRADNVDCGRAVGRVRFDAVSNGQAIRSMVIYTLQRRAKGGQYKRPVQNLPAPMMTVLSRAALRPEPKEEKTWGA